MKKIIITILSALGLAPTKKTPKRLEDKSNNVYSVFTSTVRQLRAVNEEIVTEINRREEIIEANKKEKAHLDGTLSSNESLIVKIDSFLYN